MTSSPYELPAGLAAPVDDGAAAHLWSRPLPAIGLPSTSGRSVDLAELASPSVLYFYPRTGIPGQRPTRGFSGEDWDTIPGARGCTPQSCAFRDLHADFVALGVGVYGVSTSTSAHQREFVERDHIPFEMLSDSGLELTRAMSLPTFEFPVESGGPNTLIRRMAWYVEPDATGVVRVAHLWYPVFPPDRNAPDVLEWLRGHPLHSPPGPVTIRAASVADLEWVRAELTRHWLGTRVASRDVAFQADALPALIAETGGRPIGLLTFQLGAEEWEVVTLSSSTEGRGVGAALLGHIADMAREAGARRVFLTTSNDNLAALGFYQRRGWRLVTVHRGAMDRARAAKPALPATGMNRVPMHDELELELPLRPPAGAAR